MQNINNKLWNLQREQEIPKSDKHGKTLSNAETNKIVETVSDRNSHELFEKIEQESPNLLCTDWPSEVNHK